jgi:hypothetical protein
MGAGGRSTCTHSDATWETVRVHVGGVRERMEIDELVSML